jgi:hypothetical protein
MMNFKGSHFEKEIILWGVRWYVAYPISYRQLEEIVFTQMTIPSLLTSWMVRKDIANFDFAVRYQHPINQQLHLGEFWKRNSPINRAQRGG